MQVPKSSPLAKYLCSYLQRRRLARPQQEASRQLHGTQGISAPVCSAGTTLWRTGRTLLCQVPDGVVLRVKRRSAAAALP